MSRVAARPAARHSVRASSLELSARCAALSPANCDKSIALALRKPAITSFGEVVLDLLGLEFADEPAQQLAVLVAFFALDLDGREHVAVALGDGEMQAKLGRDEMLELFANGPINAR